MAIGLPIRTDFVTLYNMQKKEQFRALLLKTVKTLVVLFTLFAIEWSVEALPFARELPFLSHKLTAAGFLSAVVSLLTVAVFIMFGAEISRPVDGLLDFIPKAGELAGNLVRILATLFAYGAFQPAVFPFIPDFEWAYQAFFLGLAVFFLARAGILLYAASESISAFLLGILNPYKTRPEDQPADPAVVRRTAGESPGKVKVERPPS